MIRNPSSTRSMPYIGLAIALLALVMLVANLAKFPVGINSNSNKISLAPVLSQAKQGGEAKSADDQQARSFVLAGARQADAARWQGMAIAYQMQQTGLSRAQLADAARWEGMARSLTARDIAALEHARAADSARWQGMAIAYYMQQTGLSRAQLADAARWSAMAIQYGAEPEDISPYLRLLLEK